MEHNMPIPLLNDPWDTAKGLSGAGDRQHRLRNTVLMRGYTMDVLAARPCRAFMLSLALLCCTELLPAQTTNCDNTTIPTLTPPAGLVDVDPDTLLRESACTPGAMGTRTPLILIHGLDGTSDISNPDLTVFMDLSLFLTQQDPSFSQNYKIFTYHYLSNEYTVSEIGLAFEIWLDYFRQSWDPYGEGDTPFDRDVIIIGHSMGGLVARALMNEDFIGAGAKAGLPAGERVIRAITLAAPHHGTALVNSTTLRLHGQSELSWEIVLNTMDFGWAVNCPACVTNITLPNRGDLRCDAYCANDIFSSTPTLYSGDDVNEWLINLASTYDGKVNAYYGSLGSYGEVPTYGADDATAIDIEMITLALALGEESLQPSSTAGLTPAGLADFHDLLQLMSIIQERIDLDNWSGTLTSVLNDGAVPEISASFDGATVAKRVSCVTSDHADMLEGTGGLCTDQTTGLTGTLFPVLDADLESLVPTGTGPLANLSPTSLSFAGQGLETTSAAATVTLSDPRSVALSITSIAIAGTNAGDYAQTNTCGGSVAAEGNCAINVTFTPLALGTRTASLTITDDAANSPQTVSLSGTGTAPLVSFSASSLSFGNQPTSTTSPAQVETVTNTGTGNLTISTVTISGTNASDFAKSADTCTGATVTPNSTCAVSVTFTPSAMGSLSASLNFTDNASGSPQTVNLTGTGVATAPVAGVSTSSLTFSNQSVGTTSASQPVTLSNTGNAALTITNIGTSANFGQTNNCGGSVAASGSCTINVTFTPTATGTLTGTLTITDNSNGAAGSTQTVSLSGTGTAPLVSFSAPSLSFASQPTSTTSPAQVETVTNTGTGNLTISTVTFGGTNASDFAKSADTCTGATVTPNSTCAASVTFTPSATGSLSASLNFTDNASGSPQTVSLTGTGVATAPVAGVSPGSLTFGNQNLGTTSGSQPVTLSNTGNAALTITGMAASANFGQTNNCGGSVAASGSCTINVTFLPTATGTLTGTLTITDNSNGVASSTQSVTLSGTGQDFSFAAASGSPTSVTVAPGSPASYTLSVGGEGGFNQSVSFTCTGAPSEATCTVSPNTLAPGSSATNIAVSVTTTAPSLNAPRFRPLPPVPPLSPSLRGLLMLALVLALMAWAIGRRNPLGVSRWRSTLVPLAARLLLTLALAGCGGGGGSS
ncbi:MAG: choice-of-anchor D domain-containing protein, partial [Terriglobia bacterium]